MGKTMEKTVHRQQSVREQPVTIETVLHHLRKHNFAVLSTVSNDGMPASAGVNYGISRPGHELAVYIMTRTHLQKTRNIAQNPNVSVVVPLARRLLWFLPPPTIQLHGRAEILDWTDAEGTDVFRHFWIGRRILASYQASCSRGERRICFLRIALDPVIYTYLVGVGIWQLRRRMAAGAATVRIPPEQLPGAGSNIAS